MLNTLLLTASSSLAVCGALLALAKRSIPITPNEAKMMWMMHRKNTSCKCHKWQPIKRKKDKIVGFRCECGYRYTQKRPLVCKSLKHGAEYSEYPAPFSF